MTVFDNIICFFDIFLIIISFCSIFNFVTIVCSEITVSTTINVLIFIIMFIVVFSLMAVISTPKYITNTFYDENEEITILNKELNPNYPGETKIKIAKNICYLLPEGQNYQITTIPEENKDIYIMPIYSLFTIVIVNIFGIYIFSKKDIK